jgi:hypothetical protein
MSSELSAADQKFIRDLIASRNATGSLGHALWASRWSLIQWFLVFAVLSWFADQVAGALGVCAVVSVGIGALLVQVVHMHGSLARWKALDQIIDWDKAINLSGGSPSEA